MKLTVQPPKDGRDWVFISKDDCPIAVPDINMLNLTTLFAITLRNGKPSYYLAEWVSKGYSK